MEDKTTTSQKCYSLLIIAISVYIIGGLLFSLWSYHTHHNALLDNTDESLKRASRALQEVHEMDTSSADFSEIGRAQLKPLCHGLSGALSIVKIDQDHCTVLISVSDELNSFLKILENSPPPAVLQNLLISMATEGVDATRMLTTTNETGTLRYAILFTASGHRQGTAYLVAKDNLFLDRHLAHEIFLLATSGLGMLTLAFPLIFLLSRSRKSTEAELSRMNAQLQRDVELQKKREVELKDAITDLKRFNAVTAGRESRIIELKAEVNELLRQQSKKTRYNIDKTD